MVRVCEIVTYKFMKHSNPAAEAEAFQNFVLRDIIESHHSRTSIPISGNQ